MLNCKQASELMSRAMDENLSFLNRFSLKVHLVLCEGCTNFSSQIFLLHKVARALGKGQDCDNLRLSDEARQRIYQELKNAQIQKEKLSSLENPNNE